MLQSSLACLAASLVLASACTSSGTGRPDAAVPFDGAFLGACTGSDYTVIPAADCPATGCLGSEVFAFCQGPSYASCACDPPSGGGSLVEAGAAPRPGDGG
jgi:hypothetical protein